MSKHYEVIEGSALAYESIGRPDLAADVRALKTNGWISVPGYEPFNKTIAMRQLTKAAQAQREEWKDLPKCSRIGYCLCASCEHPGNPIKQRANQDCWEEDKPLPPRERMKDWVQS